MGVDYLDIVSRVEKELGIELSNDELSAILKDEIPLTEDTPEEDWDFRVSTFVAWVEKTVQAQKPNCQVDVFQAVQKQLVAVLMVEEDEVTPDAWMIRELGLS